MPADTDFVITLENFGDGLSPLAHIDDNTFVGSKGQASEMIADVISNPGFLQQSPALSDLTNGNEAGVVDQLIRHILDHPTTSTTTYAVGTTKLFKLTSTSVVSGGTPSWPQAITSMASGECVIRLKENLFVLYNTASAGDIAAMPLSTEVIDPDWGSATDEALELAPHSAAVKEDILLFGNGRYVGAYIQGSALLDVKKLDYGEGAEVADIVFHANMWWIAVNYAGRRGQVYLYDGSAQSNILSDEVGLGNQKIGFLFVQNGIIYIAYDDLTSDGYAIGWISGRQIKPLRYFSGSLPDHRQKTLYKNTILFISSTSVYSFGAPVEQLPIQVSLLCDAGYDTVGAIAAPFGVPMVASTDGATPTTHYRLAKFDDLTVTSSWKSILLDVMKAGYIGNIHTVIVITKPLEADAQADITLQANQISETSSTLTVTGVGKTRHKFNSIGLTPCEDVRVVVDFENGDTESPCPIRKIIILGNFVEQ